MAAIDLMTKEDLKVFKAEMLEEIRQLLKPTMEQQKKWLKSYEVRKILGISPGTLQNLRVNGTLNYTKIGGILFYEAKDISELLEKNKH